MQVPPSVPTTTTTGYAPVAKQRPLSEQFPASPKANEDAAKTERALRRQSSPPVLRCPPNKPLPPTPPEMAAMRDAQEKLAEAAPKEVRRHRESIVPKTHVLGEKAMHATAKSAGLSMTKRDVSLVRRTVTNVGSTFLEKARTENRAVTVDLKEGKRQVARLLVMPNGNIYIKGDKIGAGGFKTASLGVKIAGPKLKAAGEQARELKVLSESSKAPETPKEKAVAQNEWALNKYLRDSRHLRSESVQHVAIGRGAVNSATGDVAVVSAYCPGGNVDNAIGKGSKLSKPQRLSIAQDLASGVRELHDLGIVHRDLKLDNCVITKNEKGKISGARVIDLGMGVFNKNLLPQRNERNPLRTAEQPPNHDAWPSGQRPLFPFLTILPPECMGEIPPSVGDEKLMQPALDIYQLGMSLYQLFSDTKLEDLPFHHGNSKGKTFGEMYDFVRNNRGDPVTWPNMDKLPSDVRGLVLSMLSDNPADRPTAAQVEAFFKKKNE